LDDSHDSKNDVGDPTNKLIVITDTIFITGLPKYMGKQCLFDKLRNVFITCGDIKVTEKKIFVKQILCSMIHFQIYERTNKPDIYLFSSKENKFQHSGEATVRFEKEESAMVAIQKYHGKLERTFIIIRRIYVLSIFQENKCQH